MQNTAMYYSGLYTAGLVGLGQEYRWACFGLRGDPSLGAAERRDAKGDLRREHHRRRAEEREAMKDQALSDKQAERSQVFP